MKGALIAIAAVAVLASSSAYAKYLTKGQVCEERAAKETYPVAMRDVCRGRLTKECRRLIDEWLTAAALEKRKCNR
jgi:hypothetical protein